MNVKNCRKCRRLFNYVMGPILCQQCREDSEAEFQKVKKYVQEHPGSGMQEVAQECEVTINQIQQWLREDRLVLSSESPMGIGCERCGKMIKSGRFCPECTAEMTGSFQNAMGVKPAAAPVQRKDTKDSPKMRFLDK